MRIWANLCHEALWRQPQSQEAQSKVVGIQTQLAQLDETIYTIPKEHEKYVT